MPESVGDNGTYKILCDFEIQTDHLVQVIRKGVVLNNKKKTCHLTDLPVPADHRVKIKESERIGKY